MSIQLVLLDTIIVTPYTQRRMYILGAAWAASPAEFVLNLTSTKQYCRISNLGQLFRTKLVEF